MTATTLNASMTRLEGIKDKKHLYNKIKIAEAEALAIEALRMANEAKLAAARLAEVKRTLSMFSRKLEKAEQSVQKDAIKLKTIPVVVKEVPVKKEELAVVKAPVEEHAKEETVEEPAVVESPVEETAIVESPVEETFKEEPAEEITVVKSPVEETFKEEPAEEIAVVESPVEEPAVVEAPVEETVEEPAVVEAPVEESVKVETVEEPAFLEAPVESEPVEEFFKTDPPTRPSGFVSRNLINNSVIKVVEFKLPSSVSKVKSISAPQVVYQPVQKPVTTRAVPAPVAQEDEVDIIEDFLDSLGVDKMCGVDDIALGFTARPVPTPAPAPEPEAPFENPTRIDYKLPLNREEIFMHSTSWREELANHQRKERQLPPRNFQRAPVNTDFSDPFGVDHDDLVLCGKLADLCEPPEFNENNYNMPDHFQQYRQYQE